MPSAKAIERALLSAGEPRARATVGGFQLKALGDGTVVVRWRSGTGTHADGADLAFVEEYAPILRAAGFNATVKADALGVSVLCVPQKAPPWRLSRRRLLRSAS
jgi:hypothetical protein